MIESVELLIKQSGHPDRTVRLPEGATRLGRAEDNEVVLADVGVSRRHAQVYVSRTEVTVEDLGSGNGTYYNGYRVQSQKIQDGDEVVVDPFVLQFRVRGTSAARTEQNPRPSAQAQLEVVVGTGMAGTNYPISSRGLSIGRSEDRDVVIPDPAASRHHAQISAQGADYVLRDMGSSNGIYVNGVRVRECTLGDGDMLRIGNTEMRFSRSGSKGSASPPRPSAPAAPASREPQSTFSDDTIQGTPLPAPTTVRMSRSRTRSMIAVLFGTAFLAVLAVVTLLLIALAVVVYLKVFRAPSVTTLEPRPPRWELKLPPGRATAVGEQLLADGQEKLTAGDHRGALEDFYRVVVERPDDRLANTLAVTAGEALVLETLQKAFSENAANEAERIRERDRLLRTAESGPRTQALEAKNVLKRKFKEDQQVIEALQLDRPASLVEMDQALAEAKKKVSAQQFDDAVILYEKVLEEATDPARRLAVVKDRQVAATEVARRSASAWTDAVMTERLDAAQGKEKFLALLDDHPSNPSALIHLGKR